MVLPMMVNGKNGSYNEGQWKEWLLQWWSVGRMALILMASGRNVTCLVLIGKMFLKSVLHRKNGPCIGGQWEECPFFEG